MEPLHDSTQANLNRLKSITDVLNIGLVFIALAVVIVVFVYIGQSTESIRCVVQPHSLIEIILGASGIVALTVVLGIPLVQVSAFGGIVWLLTKLWMCNPPGA